MADKDGEKFYDGTLSGQVPALTLAVTGEVLAEFDKELGDDCSSRLYGVVETAILHEISKEKI